MRQRADIPLMMFACSRHCTDPSSVWDKPSLKPTSCGSCFVLRLHLHRCRCTSHDGCSVAGTIRRAALLACHTAGGI